DVVARGRAGAARGGARLDLPEHHPSVLRITQDGADRLGDVRRPERRGCDLVKQRLKQMIVVAVDDQHVGGRAGQRPRSEQAAEPTTDDDDLRSAVPRQYVLRSATCKM